MEAFNSYVFIIIASAVIIVSYLFGILSKKTGIPSVLLLIVLGIVFQYVLKALDKEIPQIFSILKTLGIIGLVMIVLEASLDLKLTRDKAGLILRSFLVASVTLILSIGCISLIFYTFFPCKYINAIMYAMPLSIMSSAIVIPSVSNLSEHKKEFMIYESTFSDILGIMFFYLIKSSMHQESVGEVAISISLNVVITVVLSFVLSYGLILLFQNIRSEVKLFMFMAVLTLLFSVGKSLHLSALLIILVFGLILTNRELFFRGKLKKLLNEKAMLDIFGDFKTITLESSFLLRTFFFIVFGMIITLKSLLSFKVFLVSIIIVGIIYGIRYAFLLLLNKKDVFPQVFLAPRGLITILLFFEIGKEFTIPTFNNGIYFFIIIISSIIMAVAMYLNKNTKKNLNIDLDETEGNEIAENIDVE